MGKCRFLKTAARQLAGTCPAQARFLLWTLSNIEGKKEHLVNPVCCYCFQFLFPKNYRMRLLPKMKITSRIEKILNLEKKNYRLSLKQTKFLRKYKESKNALLITCNSCKKTTRHYGMSREEFNLKTPNLKILSNRSTPLINKNSGSKRGKSSSGLRTTTVGLSIHDFSRTQSKAKILSSQLRKMLNFEEDKNKRGNLKNFLMSL
ncbi:UPF0711 protein C18orf21 homolog isoform X1 [Notechis scutatus]|uniref:UPF0711 protein C18orf21 homolog isoform X1 n=1 Tax=Notechis scutatus TaxID=8663 RepID=A0A6J1USU9_9SAUR|nr:UPF0711 protein C18orf21 homolog isoform X1 [Notechis scutatus]